MRAAVAALFCCLADVHFVFTRSQRGDVTLGAGVAVLTADFGCQAEPSWDQFIGAKDRGVALAAAFAASLRRCASISSCVGTGMDFAFPWA